jgi:hypothetical protein
MDRPRARGRGSGRCAAPGRLSVRRDYPHPAAIIALVTGVAFAPRLKKPVCAAVVKREWLKRIGASDGDKRISEGVD